MYIHFKYLSGSRCEEENLIHTAMESQLVDLAVGCQGKIVALRLWCFRKI